MVGVRTLFDCLELLLPAQPLTAPVAPQPGRCVCCQDRHEVSEAVVMTMGLTKRWLRCAGTVLSLLQPTALRLPGWRSSGYVFGSRGIESSDLDVCFTHSRLLLSLQALLADQSQQWVGWGESQLVECGRVKRTVLTGQEAAPGVICTTAVPVSGPSCSALWALDG